MRDTYQYRLALMAGAMALYLRCMDGVRWCAAASLVVMAAGAALSAVLCGKRRQANLWLALLLLLLGLAGLRLDWTGQGAWREARYSRGEVAVVGEVALDSPLLGDDRTWVVEVLEDPSGLCGRGERVKVESGQAVTGLTWGDRVEARGEMVRYGGRPGLVQASMRAGAVRKLGESDRPLVKATNRLRECMAGFCLEDVGSGAEGHLLAGIVLGDLGILDSETSVAIRRAGLSHICAASGLNVTIMAVMVLYLGRKARLSRLALFIPTMTLVLLYVLVIGGKSPMVRASLGVPVAFLAIYAWAEVHPLSAVSITLIAMLLWQPVWLYSLSFQLSFVSILGIILLAASVRDALSRKRGKIATLLAVTIAAQLATVPLTAGCFGEVSLTAPLANLLVVPTVAPAMVFGLAGGLMKMLHIPLAFIPARLSLLTARFVLAAARTLASPGWSTLPLCGLSPAGVAAYYATLWAVFLRRNGARWRRPFLLCLAALLIFGVTVGVPHRMNGWFRAVFFDVGQGDSILLESAAGARILIDGGEDPYLLGDKLLEYGVRHIDLVILTHPDSDHLGGLGAALDECEVEAVMESGREGGELWRAWLEKVGMEGARTIRTAAGEAYSVGDLRVEVLAPSRAAQEDEEASSNELSLVCRISGPGLSVLLTGDIEEEEERWLLETGASLKADILKVPHHGGEASSSESFFKAVEYRAAVISVGAGNKYGHPAGATLIGLGRAGGAVYRTDEQGDIIIEAGAGGITVRTTKGL